MPYLTFPNNQTRFQKHSSSHTSKYIVPRSLLYPILNVKDVPGGGKNLGLRVRGPGEFGLRQKWLENVYKFMIVSITVSSFPRLFFLFLF